MKKTINCIFIFILFSFLVGCGKNDTYNKNSDDEISAAVKTFIEMDSTSGDTSLATEWKKDKNQNKLIDVADSRSLETDFIYANIALYYGEKDTAREYFEKCNATKATKDNADIIAKSKYELAKMILAEGDYDKAIALIDEIEKLYSKNSDHYIQIYIYSLWSYDILEKPNGSIEAVKIMEKAVKLAEEYDFDNMAYIYYQMAFIYSYSDEYTKVSEYNLKALKAAKEINNTYWIASVSTDIGVNYYSERNYTKALEYLLNAFELIHSENEKNNYAYSRLELYITDTIANLYIETDDLKNAEKYMEITGNILAKLDDCKDKTDNITKSYVTKAAYYIRKGYYSDALENLDIARKRYESEEYFVYTNFDNMLNQLYGAVYYGMGSNKKALEYYEKAVADFETSGAAFTDPEALEDMYHIYVENGDLDKGNEYAERLIHLLNYYLSGESRNTYMLIEEFQISERENEIEMLKYKNNSLSHVIGSSILLIGIAIYFGAMSARKNKQIKKLNEKLVEASMKDELTKLNNRRALNAYLENEWNKICNGLDAVSVAMIDVDFFKKYNDYYGHIAGDAVLSDIAFAISQKFKENCFTARYGGEEFLIIMAGTPKEAAEARIRDLQLSLEAMAIAHEKSTISDYVTISVGIASTVESIGYMEMIHYADNALYAAKRERNAIVSTDCVDGM